MWVNVIKRVPQMWKREAVESDPKRGIVRKTFPALKTEGGQEPRNPGNP